MTGPDLKYARIAQERRDDLGVVACVTLANARRMNSLSSAVMGDFIRAMETVSADPDLRAIVVTGDGDRAFMGGADIHEMNGLDAAGARTFITTVHHMCRSVREAPVPVIARVNGICLGAGLELAAACDLRVAVDHASFGMPEVNVGLPSVVEAALLPQLVGWGRTRQLVYTAEVIDARTALAWGLVEEVASPEALNDAVERFVRPIVEAAPRAVRLQKELVRHWEEMGPTAAVEEGIRNFFRAYETDEPRRYTQRIIDEIRARKAARNREFQQ